MSAVFPLQIVTPDGCAYNSNAYSLTLNTIDGYITIMAGHVPYVTAIGAGECRVVIEQGMDPRKAACIGGILSVTKEKVCVAATTFEWAENIDVARAELARKRAQERLETKLDKKNQDLAELKLKRALVRLKVAEK